MPPPTGYLNGPCGLAVDSIGRFYVSDYYHHAIDVFTHRRHSQAPAPPATSSRLANEDPLDGPCGLALDGSDSLYVNNFHRNVAKFSASPSFGRHGLPAPDDSNTPTGVAVDASNNVYVDDRTYIAVYDSTGTR